MEFSFQAELRPGRGTDTLPSGHVHEGPVDAAGKHTIQDSSDKDTAQEKASRSRCRQVFLASLMRSTHLVFLPSMYYYTV